MRGPRSAAATFSRPWSMWLAEIEDGTAALRATMRGEAVLRVEATTLGWEEAAAGAAPGGVGEEWEERGDD